MVRSTSTAPVEAFAARTATYGVPARQRGETVTSTRCTSAAGSVAIANTCRSSTLGNVTATTRRPSGAVYGAVANTNALSLSPLRRFIFATTELPSTGDPSALGSTQSPKPIVVDAVLPSSNVTTAVPRWVPSVAAPTNASRLVGASSRTLSPVSVTESGRPTGEEGHVNSRPSTSCAEPGVSPASASASRENELPAASKFPTPRFASGAVPTVS
ncbi:Uncharacterised protein [Mycobacteroides abscessus]|nr:Uncharacterised protein [Mycobacteroides abscessus]